MRYKDNIIFAHTKLFRYFFKKNFKPKITYRIFTSKKH